MRTRFISPGSSLIRVLLLTALTALTLTSCGPTAPGPVPPVPLAAHAAVNAGAHVTGTYPTSCRRAPADDPRLPVRGCTPGSTRPGVSNPATMAVTICRSGWTATVRPPTSETDRVKTQAMVAYGIPASQRGVVELDHLIPLSLGGSNDVRNLWPELSDEPGIGFRNKKDGVENRLRRAVCAHQITLPGAHQITLPVAQNAIATDWTTAEAKLGLSPR